MNHTDNGPSSSWHGDWPKRVQERVRSLGFDSVTGFTSSLPTATYYDLVGQLGADIAVVQLETVLLNEAKKRNDVKGFARSSLVRLMHEFCADGWGVGDKSDFKTARLYADWQTTLGERYRECAALVWRRLKEIHPTTGWLPQDTSDSIIDTAFAGVAFDDANQ